MLTQQINLYKHLPKAPRFQLNQSTIILSYIAFFILLLINYSHSFWLYRQHTLHLNELNKQIAQKKLELANIMAKYPIFSEKGLAQSLISLKEELNTRMKIFSLLYPGAKFSSYLTALAKAIPNGVWLNEINISNTDQNISLAGYSMQPITVQIYLDQLSHQPEFAGMPFVLQELTQTEIDKNKNYNYINFRATTKTMTSS